MSNPFSYNDETTAFIEFCGDPSDPQSQIRVVVRQPALLINQSELPIPEVAEGTAFAVTASYAETASVAIRALTTENVEFADASISASRAQTASFALTATSASRALTASFALSATSASRAQTASFALTVTSASNSITSSFALTATSASFAQTASFALLAPSASVAQSASFATTAISSSVAQTASFALTAISSSLAQTASSAITANTAISSSVAQTASLAITAISSSTAQTASFAISSSVTQFAVSASYLTEELLFGDLVNVWYVTAEGNDITNDGKTLGTAYRTIKKAMQDAEALVSQSVGFPRPRCTVLVSSGYYEEEAPIVVPPFTSIVGNDLRTSVVRPTFATRKENLFLMNNGTYAYGLRLEGCEIDDLTNPRSGFYFAFEPGAFIVTSPYIQNCTSAHTPADKFYVPLDFQGSPQPNPQVGNGPGGMIVDDSVLDPYSPLKSMIVDAYTQVAFNGMGLVVRGEGYAQQVSFFTNFSHVGVWAIEGGHASLLNSNTTFGDYGLRSSGQRVIVVADVAGISASADTDASALIFAKKDEILDNMMTRLQLSGSYQSEYLDTGSFIYQSTMKDGGILVDSISSDLLGAPGRIVNFTQALFKGQDVSTGSIYTLPTASGFPQGAIATFRVNDISRYTEASASRDVGYILDALTTDMLYGGNERSVQAGSFFHLYPSPAITTQLQKTLEGIQYTGDLAAGFTTAPAQSASIASNLATILNIVENGTGSAPPVVPNLQGNIKITSTPQITSASGATGTELVRLDTLTTTLLNIINTGTGSLPAQTNNIAQNIKVTNEPQFISGSVTASAADITALSSSIALVAQIVRDGTGSLPSIIPYTTSSTNANTLATYALLNGNIEFIKKETIAYISSSWSTASYNQATCERDIGYIVSGAAEDLLYGSNSASLASGIAYYDIPSQATGDQLLFTLDAINYVNQIAQRVVQNTTFVTASLARRATWDLLRANKTLFQEEVIAYVSSSWSEAQYDENICKRDIIYLVDALATDILYGGNERTIYAGTFYYRDPAALPAVTEQLFFTEDAIEYLAQLTQKIVVNITLIPPNPTTLTGYANIRSQRVFIRENVIELLNDALVYDFLRSWQYIKDYILNDPDNIFTTLSSAARTKIGQLLDVPIVTIRSVVIDLEPTYLQIFGSLITSTSHDFSYAGSGVNFLGLPANQRGIGRTNFAIRVFEEGGGRVYHTSGDETGDFFAGNDFIIRQATGTIDGRTFNKALLARVTPLQLALENL